MNIIHPFHHSKEFDMNPEQAIGAASADQERDKSTLSVPEDEDIIIEELPAFDLALIQGCGDASDA
ncbi:MAG TPA: hypothetical protein VGJ37_04660 [Pyrinomonadaceae bacterium]